MGYDFDTNKPTLFPQGTGQFLALGVGGSAGAITVTGGVLTTDVLKQVTAWKMTTGSFAVVDLTSEFTISADDTIDNTGGTATTNHVVCALVARGVT